MKPLVLIIDDDSEFRDEILPEFVRNRLNAEYKSAIDIQSGIKLVSEHGPDSAWPASLIILDMHIPKNVEKSEIIKDAGAQIIIIKETYNLHCPTIIFTAYPTFDDCVASVKAGACAYIPKGKHELEGGKDHLERVCLQIMKSPSSVARADSTTQNNFHPKDSWFQNNYEWLQLEFGGEWVSFIHQIELIDFKFIFGLNYKIRDGLVIISGKNYSDVLQIIMSFPEFYKGNPPIIFIEKVGDTEKGEI